MKSRGGPSRRKRITVSVSPDLVHAAESDVAAGKAPSVSSWVDQAMAERAHRESLRDILAEIRAELGPPTEEETAWARSVLGL
jgi:Arc/MetJ-type ribon-helix-helix transcriptional regulator